MAGGIVRICALALGAGSQHPGHRRARRRPGERTPGDLDARRHRARRRASRPLRPRAAPPNSPPASTSSHTTPRCTDVAQEWLLDRGLHALARLAPSPAARATVARLTAREPIVYTRVDPDHGERATPLYDTGATARFVLRNWERSAARAAAAADLAARDARVVSRFADTAADAARAGIADAFRAAPPRGDRGAAHCRRGRAGRGPARRRACADPRRAARRPGPLRPGRRLRRRARGPGRGGGGYRAHSMRLRHSRRSRARAAAPTSLPPRCSKPAGSRRTTPRRVASCSRPWTDPGIAPSAAAALGAAATIPRSARRSGGGCRDARSDGERRLLVLALRLDMSPAARAELERFSALRRRFSGLAGQDAPLARAMSRTILAALLAGAALPAGAACIFDGNDEITNPFATGCGDVLFTYTDADNSGTSHRARLSAARAGRLDDAGRGLSRVRVALRAAPVAARAATTRWTARSSAKRLRAARSGPT